MLITGRASFSSREFANQPDERVGSVAIGLLRAACTPNNLLFGAVVALGWIALIGWTGAGPDGWQARLCADLDLQPRACAAMSMTTGAERGAMADGTERSS